MKTLKNITSVAATNMINFGTSFIIGFILPLVLSVNDYGKYRQYILYMSFSYLFNLGFNDGIYIKYGGKDDKDLNKGMVRDEHAFILFFQIFIFLIMIVYALWKRDIIFTFFSVATLFESVNGYHQNFLQATGKFRLFSRANILKSFFYIITLLVTIFVLNKENYLSYILLQILGIFFIFVLYELIFLKNYGFDLFFNFTQKFNIFKIGFLLLIANMSLAFVGNIGNWIINWLYPIDFFAQYSFQNSILNVILLIVNAVGMVFYNLISTKRDEKLMIIIKKTSIYLGVSSGLVFFLFKKIIEIFMPKYYPAISLLSVTFISIPYIMVSKILITNLYKVTISQKKYLFDSISFAVLSFTLVFSVALIFNNLQAIAFATTLCYIFWFIFVSYMRFPFLKNTRRENILLVSHFFVFLFVSNFVSTKVGGIIYVIYLVLIFFTNKKQINLILKSIM